MVKPDKTKPKDNQSKTRLPEIQRHGFLLVVDTDLVIQQVSDNIDEFLGISAQEFLGKQLPSMLKFEDIKDFSEILAHTGATAETFRIKLNSDKKDYWLTAHQSEKFLILEFEKVFSPGKSLGLKLATESVNNFRSCSTMPDLLHQVAANIRLTAGYERVLVAKFDEERNANILAVSNAKSFKGPSLLGKQFSKTLFSEKQLDNFKSIPIRVLVDTKEKPANLISKDKVREIDFGGCGITTAEPEFLKFIKDLGERSSMLLSITIKGELWGLIACFSKSKKRLPLRVREACTTLSYIASACIENLVSEQERKIEANMEDRLYLLSKIIGSSNDNLDDTVKINKDYFANFIDSDGFAIVCENEVTCSGTTPVQKQVLDLIDWIAARKETAIFISRELTTQYKKAKNLNGIGGLVALNPTEETNLWLIWFLKVESYNQSRSINNVETLYAERLKESLLKHYLARTVKGKQKVEADREFLASIVESSKDAILGFSSKGEIVSWNSGAEELFQLSASEAIGSHIFGILGEDEEMFTIDGINPQETIEKTITRKDGQTLELSIKIYPISYSGDSPVFGAAMIRNITAQKQAERELLLMSQQLVETNRQLEEYAWVAAHDLKEPVRTMGTYAKLVVNDYSGKLDEDGQEMLDAIYESAQSAMHRIDDILSYSGLGRNELVAKEVDLKSVIEKVEADLSQAIKENNSTIEYKDLPMVMGDFDMLALLFQNLISNAIKFRGKRNPVVNISAGKIDSIVKITVQDNGIGIDMKYAEKIFGMFKRLNPDYPGTGLGLSIVKRIVDLHGGRIWLESTKGKGTCFQIELLSGKD